MIRCFFLYCRRVDWSPAEDSFLLLCKVASCYLFPKKRSQMITFSLVRDLLHSRFPESRNKTSRACQRRINYIMKNPTTENNVAIFLEEVRQDATITANFEVILDNFPSLFIIQMILLDVINFFISLNVLR